MRRPAQTCQVPGCNADLTNLRSYFVRQHICEEHARADAVPDGRGGYMRFCQQCTKLEPVAAFEGLKRSCEASLQKRHLRRSGGAAAAAQRSKSSGSSLAAGMALGTAAAAATTNGMARAPALPLPSGTTGAANAAAAAIAAALAGGRVDDRGSPCSTASLAGTNRSSSEGRALRGTAAVPGAADLAAATGGPLAVLMEAAGLPEAAAEPDAAGLVSIADLPPLASNTKEGSAATLPQPPLAGLPVSLLSQLPGFAPPQAAQLPGTGMLPNQLGAPGSGWPAPGGGAAPWAQQPQPQLNSIAQLQALLQSAAPPAPSVPTGGASPSAADTMPNIPSGGSSKATADHCAAQSTLGSQPQAAQEGAPQPQMDMQQMLAALQLLQQLQEVISTMVVNQVQQQQQQQQAAAQAAPSYGQQPHQQLLALLSGAAATGTQPQPAAPPMPLPMPQPQPQQGPMGAAGDGPQAQLLQFLGHLAQQQPMSVPAPPPPPPVVAPAPQARSPAPVSALPQGIDAQALQAAAAAVAGGEDEQHLKALLQRLAGSLQQA